MYGAGEYDIGFGLDAFQTLVGVAQAQPQVVIATVAPPAAQEGHQEEDESPDGFPDGDGNRGAEKTGAWPLQRDKLDLVRLDAARQIQTGWVPSGFTFHEKLSGKNLEKMGVSAARVRCVTLYNVNGVRDGVLRVLTSAYFGLLRLTSAYFPLAVLTLAVFKPNKEHAPAEVMPRA
jgi:hypothetical protein